jgi:hypothetical protein
LSPPRVPGGHNSYSTRQGAKFFYLTIFAGSKTFYQMDEKEKAKKLDEGVLSEYVPQI